MVQEKISGFVCTCTKKGKVKNVFRDDLKLFAELSSDATYLEEIIGGGSEAKLKLFLREIDTDNVAINWEITVIAKEDIIVLSLNGVSYEEDIIVVGTSLSGEVDLFLEELTKINSEQVNHLRRLLKEKSQAANARTEASNVMFDEMTRLNNELASLQRDLTKKNIELEKVYKEMEKIALTDRLTAIYNRWGFFSLADREFSRAKRYRTKLSLMMFDLDHFKKVNDVYGHNVGDVVLKETAARCQKIIRDSDILGRTGGEEFLILLPEANIEDTCMVAERIREAVKEPIEAEGKSLSISVSIGVAALTESYETMEQFLKAVDLALYEAKETGRDRVVVAS